MSKWWETDDWPANKQGGTGDGTAPAPSWTPRCRCGAPATATLHYVWDGVGTRKRPVCRQHMDAALDLWDRMRSHRMVSGLRVLVGAA